LRVLSRWQILIEDAFSSNSPMLRHLCKSSLYDVILSAGRIAAGSRGTLGLLMPYLRYLGMLLS
jgi:hypothetical protein